DTDVQRELDDFDSAPAKFFKHFIREMQARRRRCNGSGHTRVNGLVFDRVGRRVWTLDIRWKRYVTVRLENLVDVGRNIKETESVIQFGTEPSIEFSAREDDAVAFADALSRPDHHFPGVFAGRRCKQNFHVARCAGSAFEAATDARTNHTRI